MTRHAKLIALALLVAGLAAAATPWRVSRATVAGAFDGELARRAGLHMRVGGAVTFKLLPRPRIQATELSATAGNGAVLLDAPLLKAELDIPSLLAGAWRLTSATLVEPTVTVDLDRLAARLPTGPDAAAPAGSPLHLRLRSGLLRTRSAAGAGDQLVTGIDASLAWPDADALTASGTAAWRGAAVQFAAGLQHASRGLGPRGAPATLQIESPLFTLSAEGLLSGGARPEFAGRVSLGTAALPRLLRVLGGPPLPGGAQKLQVSGDLVARPPELSLSDGQLRLDRARFEGTLAWRRDGGRGLVAGTLATDFFDLDALERGVDRDALQAWYRRPLDASPFGADIDLRISATRARLGRFALDDVAVAALVRGDRLELTLDEAQAYGGVVKARALATVGAGGIDGHAEVSAKRVDLAALSEAMSGHRRAAGAVTAHAELDGRGASLDVLVGRLAGTGQLGIEGGRLAGLSLAQTLRRLSRHVPLDADRRATPTTFDKALWTLAVHDGIVRIPDGRLTAPGVAVSFGAEAGLPDGRIDVEAVAAQTDSGGASIPFDMRGFWSGPLTLTGRGPGFPAIALPLFDGLAAER